MKEIQLTRGKVAIVDDSDFEWLSQWKWCALKLKSGYYAVRSICIQPRPNQKSATIYMHRLIMGISDPKTLCDHINHDGLDNQRSNLRLATRGENNANKISRPNSSSKYLGVYWDKQMNKWCAQIRKNKKSTHLGFFHSESEAGIAYNEAAIIIHGGFANLNTT